MRTHSTKATAIALIAAASMCFVFASSVQAQSLQTGSSVKFQKAQEAVEHQIIARQVQLVLLGTEVANATNVTTTDRLSLVGIITSEQTALETDAANAAAATTYAALDAVQKAVVADERVYAVVTAQVGLVISADNDTVTEVGYTGLAAELAPLVAELGSTHATQLLADVTSRVAAATSLTTGVSADASLLLRLVTPATRARSRPGPISSARSQRTLASPRPTSRRSKQSPWTRTTSTSSSPSRLLRLRQPQLRAR